VVTLTSLAFAALRMFGGVRAVDLTDTGADGDAEKRAHHGSAHDQGLGQSVKRCCVH
jgi:hypothetical protein